LYFFRHPDRAVMALDKINETLYETNETTETFALTIAYINNPVNQAELVGGTSTCNVFFSGLKDQLVADWKNKKLSETNAETNALSTLQNLYNIINGVIN
jgi:hypothetical protein